jgi:hypothetical protein
MVKQVDYLRSCIRHFDASQGECGSCDRFRCCDQKLHCLLGIVSTILS